MKPKLKPFEFVRSTPLIDIEIARGGDGRTVTAYAATFDTPYEVRDFDGHYDEVIDRAAFNRQLGRGIAEIQVLYNHGLTAWGTPSELDSGSIGVPLEVRAEARGLLTVTRYNTNERAERVLSDIKDGAIRFMSFRGPVYRSAAPSPGPNGRPVIRRLELGLKEYGPVLWPANSAAAILAVRTSALTDQVASLTVDERAALLEILQAEPHLGGSSVDPEPQEQPAEAPPVVEAPEAPAPGPSVDVLIAANANRRRR